MRTSNPAECAAQIEVPQPQHGESPQGVAGGKEAPSTAALGVTARWVHLSTGSACTLAAAWPACTRHPTLSGQQGQRSAQCDVALIPASGVRASASFGSSAMHRAVKSEALAPHEMQAGVFRLDSSSSSWELSPELGHLFGATATSAMAPQPTLDTLLGPASTAKAACHAMMVFSILPNGLGVFQKAILQEELDQYMADTEQSDLDASSPAALCLALCSPVIGICNAVTEYNAIPGSANNPGEALHSVHTCLSCLTHACPLP